MSFCCCCCWVFCCYSLKVGKINVHEISSNDLLEVMFGLMVGSNKNVHKEEAKCDVS